MEDGKPFAWDRRRLGIDSSLEYQVPRSMLIVQCANSIFSNVQLYSGFGLLKNGVSYMVVDLREATALDFGYLRFIVVVLFKSVRRPRGSFACALQGAM